MSAKICLHFLPFEPSTIKYYERSHFQTRAAFEIGQIDIDARQCAAVSMMQARFATLVFRIADSDISLQQRDTDKVWEGMLGIAKQLGFPVEVSFRWPQREGVAFPGETGRLVFDPTPPDVIPFEDL